jgi:hypothetical protein
MFGAKMQQNLAINAIYSAINSLPKKMQLSLIEKFIYENDLINDLIDMNIAKQRISEQGTDYEEFRRNRKRIQ